jgi:hypothetical protein
MDPATGLALVIQRIGAWPGVGPLAVVVAVFNLLEFLGSHAFASAVGFALSIIAIAINGIGRLRDQRVALLKSDLDEWKRVASERQLIIDAHKSLIDELRSRKADSSA